MASKSDIIDDIQKIAKDHDYLAFTNYREEGNFTKRQIKNKFGNWSDAKKKAGLEVKNLKIPKEELLEDIKESSKEVKYLSRYNYPEVGKYSVNTIRNRFGNWSDAKKKAGLEVRKDPIRVTKEEAKEDVKRVFEKTEGDRLTLVEYKKKGKYSLGPVNKYGWNNLLRELEIETYHNIKHIPKEEVLEELKEMENVGVGNMKEKFQQHNISQHTVKNKFGTIRKGLKKAGVWITEEEALEIIYNAIEQMDSGYHKSTDFREEVKDKTGLRINVTGVKFEKVVEYCNERDIQISRNSNGMRVYLETGDRYSDEESYENYLYEKFKSFNEMFEFTCERFDMFKKYIGKGFSPTTVFGSILYVESKMSNEKITQKQISNELEVSEVSIRNLYQDIRDAEELKVEKTK